MGKCMLCGKETKGQVCEKCQRDYELKLKEIENNEQKSLDILAEKRDTSGFEYLLHVLAFLCILSIIVFINDGLTISIAYAVGGCISFEVVAQIIKWIRLAVNELIEIKAKMK